MSDKAREYHVLEANGIYIKTVDYDLYQAAQEEIEQLKLTVAERERVIQYHLNFVKKQEKEIDDLSGQALSLQDELKVWKTKDAVRLWNENEQLKSKLARYEGAISNAITEIIDEQYYNAIETLEDARQALGEE